jgi:hypothetical protein
MGCCGKVRSNLSVSRGALQSQPVVPQPQLNRLPVLRPVQPGGDATMVRYSGVSNIAVRGPATGRRYTFSPAQPTQIVDMHDAAALMRTNYFRPA